MILSELCEELGLSVPNVIGEIQEFYPSMTSVEELDQEEESTIRELFKGSQSSSPHTSQI